VLKITAYADKLSVIPGEAISLKVSCTGLTSYRAELRRIIQGDTNPEGPGYQDELIPCEPGGPFKARYQPLRAGSYAVVDDPAALYALRSYTIAALIWPTTPGARRQAIVAHGGPDGGIILSLDSSGASVSVQSGIQTVSACVGRPCLERHWYLVAASVDYLSGKTLAAQRALKSWPGIADSGLAQSTIPRGPGRSPGASLTIAARLDPSGIATDFYNGKIEAPCVYEGVVSIDQIFRDLAEPPYRSASAIAAWDFSRDMTGDHIVDVGPNSLHGRTKNFPHRAVTGSRWDGSTHRWRDRPAHYGAIHFHDDDVYDAEWDTDFVMTIPDDVRSGVYAVRLFSDEDADAEYYVVVAVRPAPNAPRASVVFVMPTASYLAYANHRLGIDISETEIGMGQLIQLDKHHLHLQMHPEAGLSIYEVHSDGSGVFYSSRLRPILDVQPKVQGFDGGYGSNLWQFNADTHILGWLERSGIRFDVLTDEDLDCDPERAFIGYRVAITGTHPEYSTTRMLDAYAAFMGRGGRLMYLGGNGFYWRASYHPTLPGLMECRRSESGIRPWDPGVGNYWHAFTDEPGGLWRRLGRPPNVLVGVGMTAQGFDESSPYHRSAASRDPRAAFIFAGVDAEIFGDFGLNGGAAAGSEIDRADPALGTPPHALILASSERHTDVFLVTPEDLLDPVPSNTGTQSDLIRADLVFFETPAGGAVFSVGSIAFADSLAWNRYENDVTRVASNVLARFIDPAPFCVPDGG
jgi:N,N-dimethylformamidase